MISKPIAQSSSMRALSLPPSKTIIFVGSAISALRVWRLGSTKADHPKASRRVTTSMMTCIGGRVGPMSLFISRKTFPCSTR